MTSELDAARTDAVLELTEEIVYTISKSILIHGKDPANLSIIAAALAHTVDHINYFDPTFRELLVGLLSNKEMVQLADETLKVRFKHLGIKGADQL